MRFSSRPVCGGEMYGSGGGSRRPSGGPRAILLLRSRPTIWQCQSQQRAPNGQLAKKDRAPGQCDSYISRTSTRSACFGRRETALAQLNHRISSLETTTVEGQKLAADSRQYALKGELVFDCHWHCQLFRPLSSTVQRHPLAHTTILPEASQGKPVLRGTEVEKKTEPWPRYWTPEYPAAWSREPLCVPLSLLPWWV